MRAKIAILDQKLVGDRITAVFVLARLAVYKRASFYLCRKLIDYSAGTQGL